MAPNNDRRHTLAQARISPLQSERVGPPRISLRRRSLLVAGLALLLMTLVIGITEASYLLYVIGLLLLVSYFWTRFSTETLIFQRKVETDRAHVGDTVHEYFELTNLGRLPLLWIEFQDFSDLPGYSAQRVEVAGIGDTRRWRNQAPCLRRGLFRLGPARITTGDPFGIFQAEIDLPATQRLLVLPPLVSLPEIGLPLGSLQGSARSNLSAPLPTSTISGVRDYRPGDPRSRIAWPYTAHRGELTVKESEIEPSGDLWLVLDLDRQVQVGEGDEASLERGVLVAASLAQRAIQEWRAVGLAAGGLRIGPEKGIRQLRRLLEALALAEPADGPPFHAVLRQIRPVLGHSKSLIAITPSTDGGWIDELVRLAAQGIAPVVVLLTPMTSSGDVGKERIDGLRVRLAWLGFPCYVLDAGRRLLPSITFRRATERHYTALGTGGAAILKRGSPPKESL